MINHSHSLFITMLLLLASFSLHGMFDGKTSRKILTIKNGLEIEDQTICLGLASNEIDTLAAMITHLSSTQNEITLKAPFVSQKPNDSFLIHMQDGETITYKHNRNAPRPDRRQTVVPHTLYQRSLLFPLLAFSPETFQARSLNDLGQLLSYCAKTDGGDCKVITILGTEKHDEFFILGIPTDVPAWSKEGLIIYCQKNSHGKIMPVAQGTSKLLTESYSSPDKCSFVIDCKTYLLQGKISFFKNSLEPACWEPHTP